MCIAAGLQLRSAALVSREVQHIRDLTAEATRPSLPRACNSARSEIVGYWIFCPWYALRSSSLHPLIRVGSHAVLYITLPSHPSARAVHTILCPQLSAARPRELMYDVSHCTLGNLYLFEGPGKHELFYRLRLWLLIFSQSLYT